MNTPVSHLDWAIIAIYLFAVVGLGVAAGFLHRNGRGARSFDNLITTNNPGFADPARGDFSMKKSAAGLAELGFAPLPFAGMGPYRDDHRRQLPEQLIRALRGEQ